jgi:hypothetical protein
MLKNGVRAADTWPEQFIVLHAAQLGRAAIPARVLVTWAVALGCGGQSAAVGSPGAEAQGGNDGAASGTMAECVDVFFTGGLTAPTGLVACPVKGDEGNADLYSTRNEACEGRGRGMPHPAEDGGGCTLDSDCSVGSTCQDGTCFEQPQCDEDSQCETGSTCACAGVFAVGSSFATAISLNQCVPAECRSDSDCGAYSCGLSQSNPCGGLDGFYCHSESDECARHSDCGSLDRLCAYDTDARGWHCKSRQRLCGL